MPGLFPSMPAPRPLQGPLTPAAQKAADQLAVKYAGTPTRFYPSIDQVPTAPTSIAFSDGDMVWRKGRGKERAGFGLWIRPRSTPRTTSVPTRTRENISACAALGLSFWSEAPPNRTLWALDSAQRVHMVRMDRTNGTVQHLCGREEARGYRDTHGRCRDSGRSAEFIATQDDTGLWELADFRPPQNAMDTPAEAPSEATAHTTSKHGLKVTQQLLLFVAAQIRKDSSELSRLDSEILTALHATRRLAFTSAFNVTIAQDIMPLIEAEVTRRAEEAKAHASNDREAVLA